ncbi:hypothetical protein SD70_01175 [Gordoniibacillus kamchatkensis]|uniref:UmuC domain-containing protein n=1 Tax=Gordoniibacillus kamchatkensis TaxID=1590651 RepID=A0ABR5ANC5_9BACL|nr:hypothetical protein SD70_01175 [Paenibacillus sp. VKM B-2647]
MLPLGSRAFCLCEGFVPGARLAGVWIIAAMHRRGAWKIVRLLWQSHLEVALPPRYAITERCSAIGGISRYFPKIKEACSVMSIDQDTESPFRGKLAQITELYSANRSISFDCLTITERCSVKIFEKGGAEDGNAGRRATSFAQQNSLRKHQLLKSSSNQ